MNGKSLNIFRRPRNYQLTLQANFLYWQLSMYPNSCSMKIWKIWKGRLKSVVIFCREKSLKFPSIVAPSYVRDHQIHTITQNPRWFLGNWFNQMRQYSRVSNATAWFWIYYQWSGVRSDLKPIENLWSDVRKKMS